MAVAKYDVFLSYSRADSARVALLRDEFERRGYRVFFDVQSIEPGEKWKRRLERAVRRSRTLVLCWSEHSRASDYCTFEYARAEALGRKVFPWLLDGTPLPAMLEVNGIKAADPVQVVAQLAPALGWTLGRRRVLQGMLAGVAVIALAFALWHALQPASPPPPWEFGGEVTERGGSALPIAGVEVDLKENGSTISRATTDAQGRVDFRLPQPEPKTVLVVLRKPGYEGDEAMRPTGKPFSADLARLP